MKLFTTKIAIPVFLAIAGGALCLGLSPTAKKTPVHGVGWYANFADATAEAKRTGKPILFLSMFGRLDEEMACANARTLRATLFKDPDFKRFVTYEAIPAWEMVRKVPKIEIDLGDGKKIRRTVRGNAVMYLCNSSGKVVDAFPGVYTPRDFMPMVRQSVSKLAQADSKGVAAFHSSFPVRNLRPLGMTTTKAMMQSPTLKLLGAKTLQSPRTPTRPSTRPRERFLSAANLLSDMSLTPMSSPVVVRTLTDDSKTKRSSAELAQRIIEGDSKRNIGMVRTVVHLWLASETKLLTPAQARDTMLETILKIPYKDPYWGLKDVVVPGTPD